MLISLDTHKANIVRLAHHKKWEQHTTYNGVQQQSNILNTNGKRSKTNLLTWFVAGAPPYTGPSTLTISKCEKFVLFLAVQDRSISDIVGRSVGLSQLTIRA